jgi:hypothetical protein
MPTTLSPRILDTTADPARIPTGQRTYFVAGHRVEHVHDALGHSSWVCDCAEYVRGPPCGGERWCQHAERVAAAAELDRLLRTPSLILPIASY